MQIYQITRGVDCPIKMHAVHYACLGNSHSENSAENSKNSEALAQSRYILYYYQCSNFLDQYEVVVEQIRLWLAYTVKVILGKHCFLKS